MSRVSIVMVFLVALLALNGCVREVAEPVKEKQATPAPVKSGAASESDWQKLVDAAKKEGVLSLYTIAGPETRIDIAKAFKDKFGINTEFVSGRGGELAEKLLTERRAGLYLADITIGGGTTPITQLKPEGVLSSVKQTFILPEVLDLTKWFQGKHWWVDKEGTYVLGFTLFTSPYVLINTDLVKEEELKSYRGLLNPKWKDKIIINDPSIAGTGARFFGVVGAKIMGYDFMRELAKQNPMITRDRRLQVESVARGKYPIGLGAESVSISEFRSAGAPIKDHMPSEGSGLVSGSGNLSLIERAPHPNAAKLFINWFLTKEGQTLWSKSLLNPSARIDVPTDHVDPVRVPSQGQTYFMSDAEEFLLEQPDHMKVSREIFGSHG